MPLTHALWLFNLATGVHGTLTSNIITWVDIINRKRINTVYHRNKVPSVLQDLYAFIRGQASVA